MSFAGSSSSKNKGRVKKWIYPHLDGWMVQKNKRKHAFKIMLEQKDTRILQYLLCKDYLISMKQREGLKKVIFITLGSDPPP